MLNPTEDGKVEVTALYGEPLLRMRWSKTDLDYIITKLNSRELTHISTQLFDLNSALLPEEVKCSIS